MRMTSLAVLSALAAAACVRGAPRVEPVSASSEAQSGGRENTTLQGSADANSQSEFDYRRVHSSAGRFITAGVLSANGDRSLEEVLREHLLGFASSRGARPSPPNGTCGVDVYVNGLHSIDVFDGIRPRDLLGVEYYEAGSAPVNYRRAFSTCPVLLLWLKP
jgi:hypothetical protein